MPFTHGTSLPSAVNPPIATEIADTRAAAARSFGMSAFLDALAKQTIGGEDKIDAPGPLSTPTALDLSQRNLTSQAIPPAVTASYQVAEVAKWWPNHQD